VKVFFDNNTSPIWANVLNALAEADKDSAHHIRFMPEYGLSAGSSDVDWIERLSKDSLSDWIVITFDSRIRKDRANRKAWLEGRLKGFVLASGFQKMPVNQVASILLWRWPEMRRFIGSVAPPSLFELPVKRSGQFRSLTV
jgi:hypothetical protein